MATKLGSKFSPSGHLKNWGGKPPVGGVETPATGTPTGAGAVTSVLGTPAADGSNKSAEQLMADVVEMYSGEGAMEDLYQSNKQKFIADTLGRLGPAMSNTTRPAMIAAGYEREVGPGFAATKMGLLAGAKTNLAALLEARNTLQKQLDMQKYLTELGISSEEQRIKWDIESREKIQTDLNAVNLQLTEMNITSTEKMETARVKAGLESTGMQVASQRAGYASQAATAQAGYASEVAINAARNASEAAINAARNATTLQVAGMQYGTGTGGNYGGYSSTGSNTPGTDVLNRISSTTTAQKLTQPSYNTVSTGSMTTPTTSSYQPVTGYQAYQNAILPQNQWMGGSSYTP